MLYLSINQENKMAYTIQDKNFDNKDEIHFLIDERVFLYLKENYMPGREYAVGIYCHYLMEMAKILYKNKHVVIHPPHEITDEKERHLFHLIRIGFYGVIIHQ